MYVYLSPHIAVYVSPIVHVSVWCYWNFFVVGMSSCVHSDDCRNSGSEVGTYSSLSFNLISLSLCLNCYSFKTSSFLSSIVPASIEQ